MLPSRGTVTGYRMNLNRGFCRQIQSLAIDGHLPVLRSFETAVGAPLQELQQALKQAHRYEHSKEIIGKKNVEKSIQKTVTGM